MSISAKILARSSSPTANGAELITFELEYPRIIHAELMTHRVFSRNAASSRAIPVNKSIELIENNMAFPEYWGKNRPGMSAKEECNTKLARMEFVGFGSDGLPAYEPKSYSPEEIWEELGNICVEYARWYADTGYHKQIVNRILETFSHIKVIVTSSEYDNWYELRNHADAQPEIRILAQAMLDELENTKVTELEIGSWHLPYYRDGAWIPTNVTNGNGELVDVRGSTLDDATAISSSCSAQISYRVLNTNIEKARDLYKRLASSVPAHLSPFEHQATPMDTSTVGFDVLGVTHLDRAGNYWSGNFKHWIQFRQLLMMELNLEHMTSKYLGDK